MSNKERLNDFGSELGRLLEFQNISINEYADRIGTTPKNLIDIIDGKVSLSFNMICNIAFISEIPVDYICNVEESFKIDNKIDEFTKENNITVKEYLKRFNYKELSSLYNLKYRDERNDYSILEDILKYLRIVNPRKIYENNNHIFYKSKNDKPELLALWLERCYRIVMNQEIGVYNKNNIDKLVEFIRIEANENKFNRDRLIKEFNKNGVYLAIESDLSGAKIRGAFRVLNDKPAIYITTKHKRYADVYFALLHEIAHLKSDFNRAKNGALISLEEEKNSEDYEIRADETALNYMVDSKEYEKILKNGVPSKVNSFLAYRLARDGVIKYSSKLYQDSNKLIDN